MDDLNRNTNEVIMQINNLFRYADPVFRLTTIGTIKLIQFLARMAKEKRLSSIEAEDFVKFLKTTDGKYDIMNIPVAEKEVLSDELGSLGIRYSILPDLDREDGLMQVAVYQPDREKFGSWYERYLINRMQGGEKELKELRGLTGGNVSIVSFPLEGREDGIDEDFKALGINYARLPDLRVGDGSIQFEIANSDMGKVSHIGTIFLDALCKPDFSSFNSIIYGHNLKNGEMFGHLKKLYDVEYNGKADYRKHPKAWIITPKESYEYEIFAFREISVGKDINVFTVEIPDSKERREFLNHQIRKSQKDTGICPSENRRMITLSTCTSRTREGRFIVQATLIE